MRQKDRCPICKKPMQIVRDDNVLSFKHEQSIYKCVNSDCWLHNVAVRVSLEPVGPVVRVEDEVEKEWKL